MLALRYGTPRDQLLGVTAVLADGTVARGSGGVPAAAGHDLPALFAGSYGTLGLITEVTFRVHPLARGSAGVGFRFDGPDEAGRITGIVAADTWLAVTGISLHWPAADEPILASVLVEHDSEDYQDRVDRLHVLAGRAPVPPPDRATVRRLDAPDHGGLPPAVAQQLIAHRDRVQAEMLDPPPETGTMARAWYAPTRLAPALTAARAAASGLPALVKGHLGTGFLDVTVPAGVPAAVVARFAAALRADPEVLAAAVVYAPDDVRELTGTGDLAGTLAAVQAAKDELDPGHRMAPGRLS
jgi:glycolate oxidase FAD binding subunit